MVKTQSILKKNIQDSLSIINNLCGKEDIGGKQWIVGGNRGEGTDCDFFNTTEQFL